MKPNDGLYGGAKGHVQFDVMGDVESQLANAKGHMKSRILLLVKSCGQQRVRIPC